MTEAPRCRVCRRSRDAEHHAQCPGTDATLDEIDAVIAVAREEALGAASRREQISEYSHHGLYPEIAYGPCESFRETVFRQNEVIKAILNGASASVFVWPDEPTEASVRHNLIQADCWGTEYTDWGKLAFLTPVKLLGPQPNRQSGKPDAWLDKLFDGVIHDVRTRPEGDRNNRLRWGARRLGEYAHYERWTKTAAEDALLRAAHDSGVWAEDGDSQCRASIASGWNKGTAEPKEVG